MRDFLRLGKTVHVKFKYGDFSQKIRSKTLPAYTDSYQEFWNAIEDIMHKEEVYEKDVRLLGVSISNLDNIEKQQALGQLTLDF